RERDDVGGPLRLRLGVAQARKIDGQRGQRQHGEERDGQHYHHTATFTAQTATDAAHTTTPQTAYCCGCCDGVGVPCCKGFADELGGLFKNPSRFHLPGG